MLRSHGQGRRSCGGSEAGGADGEVARLNKLFKKVSKEPEYDGVIGVTEEELVSKDFVGDPRSCIVDLPLTDVVCGNMIKVVAWYDNEWGYSNRLVELALDLGDKK